MGFDVPLDNRTPFDAATHMQLDAEGQEVLLVMVSASFGDPGRDGNLQIAAEQMPVLFADEPFGDPATSSMRHEADIALVKPGAEVVVIGSACAPGDVPVPKVDVGLQIGPIRKALTVTGDRFLARDGVSEPQPFLSMPIVWERAYGGTLPDGNLNRHNPCGVGWKDARSADRQVRTHFPNVTYQGDDSAAPRPAGFGHVGRGWLPRLPLAGTYDQAWLDSQWPLPAKDFDPRYNLSAPEDQRAASLPPGTSVALANMTPGGRWSFRLPGLRVPLRLIYADRIEEPVLAADTVILEPDLGRVTLKARHAIPLIRNRPRLREILLGHVSPVLISAKRKGKTYLNLLGGDGTLLHEPVWSL